MFLKSSAWKKTDKWFILYILWTSAYIFNVEFVCYDEWVLCFDNNKFYELGARSFNSENLGSENQYINKY